MDEDGAAIRGFVDAVIEGDDVEAFDRHAEDAMFDLGWKFVGTERVEWCASSTDSARELALAIAALEEQSIALGTAYEWPDAPQAVDREETKALEEAVAAQRVVYATTEDEDVLGFVVDFSDELVLVHHVDSDVVVLDGYVAIRRSEFLRIKSPDADTSAPSSRSTTRVVRGVDRTGAWVEEYERELDEIVRVEVLGGYLRALERVAGPLE